MIVEQILEAKQRKIREYPVHANRASELGHPCLKYLVLLRTRWQERPLISVDLQMVFDMGRMVERSVEDDLREAGLTIIEQQRSFSWAKYQITGNIDLKLALIEELVKTAGDNGTCPPEIREKLTEQFLHRMNDRATAVVPSEIKSSAPHPWESVNSVQDMLRHKYLYMRKYPAQLTLYLIMDGKEVGLFLLKNKVTGKLKEIWMLLDYDFAESLIKKAEAVNKHVAEGTLPDPMDYDEDICGECPFAHICLPDRIGKEVEVTDDGELLELVTRYFELKPGAKEYDEVNERINKLVEGREKILVGDYFIEGKYVTRKVYHVPDDVKAKYAGTSQSWQKKIIPIGKEVANA
jgi:CRISPR/Cas system-associated exonuclease Cas4 (RecB family)